MKRRIWISGYTYNAGLQARLKNAGITLTEKSKGEFNRDIAEIIGVDTSMVGLTLGMCSRHMTDPVWEQAEQQREADYKSARMDW